MAEILGAEVDEEGYLIKVSDWSADIAVSYTHLTLPTTPYV